MYKPNTRNWWNWQLRSNGFVYAHWLDYGIDRLIDPKYIYKYHIWVSDYQIEVYEGLEQLKRFKYIEHNIDDIIVYLSNLYK
jgi:hypothetical protein